MRGGWLRGLTCVWQTLGTLKEYQGFALALGELRTLKDIQDTQGHSGTLKDNQDTPGPSGTLRNSQGLSVTYWSGVFLRFPRVSKDTQGPSGMHTA